MTLRASARRLFLWSFLAFMCLQFVYPKDRVLDFFYFAVVLPSLVLTIADKGLRSSLRAVRAPLVCAGVFFLWSSVSAAWAGGPWPAALIDGFRQGAMTASFLLAALIFLLAARGGPGRLADAMTAAAAIGGALSIVMFWAQGAEARLVPAGQFDQEVQGAAAYGLVGLLAAVQGLRASSRSAAAAYGAVFAVIGLTIALTQSRMPLFAFAAGAGALLILHAGWARSAAVGATAFVLGAASLLLEGPRAAAAAALAALAERGDAYRFEIWRAAWDLILERPFLGHGYEASFPVIVEGVAIAHPHNQALGLWYYSGPAAVLAMAALFAWLVAALSKRPIDRARATMLIFLAYGPLVTLTDYGPLLGAPDEIWTFFWLPIALALCAVADPAGAKAWLDTPARSGAEAESRRAARLTAARRRPWPSPRS